MPIQSSTRELRNEWPLVQIGPRSSQRRERRFPVSIPLLVCGFGPGCHLFRELVSTFDISRAGCRIRLQTRPMKDSVLALRLVPREGPILDSPQLLYQVAWFLPEGDRWNVGTFALGHTDLVKAAFGPSPQ